MKNVSLSDKAMLFAAAGTIAVSAAGIMSGGAKALGVALLAANAPIGVAALALFGVVSILAALALYTPQFLKNPSNILGIKL